MKFYSDWLKTLTMAAALATPAWALQDAPPPGAPPQEEDDEDQMTPEQALEMLKEVQGLMSKAEELLNDSSRGKALETEQELLEKFKLEFKDDPSAMQKQILEKVQKLTERAAQREKAVIEKLAEVIKKAKS